MNETVYTFQSFKLPTSSFPKGKEIKENITWSLEVGRCSPRTGGLKDVYVSY